MPRSGSCSYRLLIPPARGCPCHLLLLLLLSLLFPLQPSLLPPLPLLLPPLLPLTQAWWWHDVLKPRFSACRVLPGAPLRAHYAQGRGR